MTEAGRGPVVVTGGTSGIGLAVAAAVVADGRPVTVLGRDAGRREAAVRFLSEVGGSHAPVLALEADTIDESALQRAVHRTIARWGRLDGLVTSAGRLARGSTVDLAPAEFRAALETNVLGTWLAVRACLPAMLEQRHGRIVTIGSVLGTVGAAERAAYAATKGAVAAFTRSLALEVAGRGVTANCVAPGPVRSPMNAAQAADTASERFDGGIPAGRWGAPSDVASAVLPLLAPAASWTTGAVIHVDGGYTAQ